MNENDARREICRVGRSLFERGYAHGTAGNISVRLADGYLITPADACLGYLDAESLAKVSTTGTQVGGARASKTLTLHRHIYTSDPDAGCVIHTHSTHCVALTLSGTWHADAVVPPITPYFVIKVGRVPLIAYHRPGDPTVGARVAELIARFRSAARPIRAVMIERLGPNVWHRTPAEAMAVLEELEETARLWTMTKPTPLTTQQIDELCERFGASW